MNRIFLIAFLALFALASSLLPAAARNTELLPAASTGIELAVGKGRIVKLSKPAASVFIADPTVADVQVKSPQLVYIFGKAGGATTLYAVGDNDEVLLSADLHVHYDVERVQQAIHALVPRSAISVNAVDDSIVLTGSVYSVADGDDIKNIAARFVHDPKQLVNKMKITAPTQLNLRVRIAEVSRDVVKQFGINWQNMINNGTVAFGMVTSGAALASVATGANGIFPVIPGSSTIGFNTHDSTGSGSTNNNLYAGFRSGSSSINTLIDALDNHGLVTLLAEPNLTAISGEPANFLAGGEFPVPVPAGQGLVGIDWKQFGVSLNFVATIAADNRINLHVMPEVSELSNAGSITIDGSVVPSLTTRRADTTVELSSGQTFAIAGLLQNNVTQNINKFPWLGDVPVLGQLFRSEAFQRNESELVILVTPYIVHPIADATAGMLPTDGYVPSTDNQLVLSGSEYQRQPAPAPKAPTAAAPAAAVVPTGRNGTSLIGPIGFDME